MGTVRAAGLVGGVTVVVAAGVAATAVYAVAAGWVGTGEDDPAARGVGGFVVVDFQA